MPSWRSNPCREPTPRTGVGNVVPNVEALLAQADWVTFGRQSCLTAGEETGDLRHRQFVY